MRELPLTKSWAAAKRRNRRPQHIPAPPPLQSLAVVENNSHIAQRIHFFVAARNEKELVGDAQLGINTLYRLAFITTQAALRVMCSPLRRQRRRRNFGAAGALLTTTITTALLIVIAAALMAVTTTTNALAAVDTAAATSYGREGGSRLCVCCGAQMRAKADRSKAKTTTDCARSAVIGLR